MSNESDRERRGPQGAKPEIPVGLAAGAYEKMIPINWIPPEDGNTKEHKGIIVFARPMEHYTDLGRDGTVSVQYGESYTGKGVSFQSYPAEKAEEWKKAGYEIIYLGLDKKKFIPVIIASPEIQGSMGTLNHGAPDSHDAVISDRFKKMQLDELVGDLYKKVQGFTLDVQTDKLINNQGTTCRIINEALGLEEPEALNEGYFGGPNQDSELFKSQLRAIFDKKYPDQEDKIGLFLNDIQDYAKKNPTGLKPNNPLISYDSHKSGYTLPILDQSTASLALGNNRGHGELYMPRAEQQFTQQTGVPGYGKPIVHTLHETQPPPIYIRTNPTAQAHAHTPIELAVGNHAHEQHPRGTMYSYNKKSESDPIKYPQGDLRGLKDFERFGYGEFAGPLSTKAQQEVNKLTQEARKFIAETPKGEIDTSTAHGRALQMAVIAEQGKIAIEENAKKWAKITQDLQEKQVTLHGGSSKKDPIQIIDEARKAQAAADALARKGKPDPREIIDNLRGNVDHQAQREYLAKEAAKRPGGASNTNDYYGHGAQSDAWRAKDAMVNKRIADAKQEKMVVKLYTEYGALKENVGETIANEWLADEMKRKGLSAPESHASIPNNTDKKPMDTPKITLGNMPKSRDNHTV